MPRIGVSITKSTSFRNGVQEFSNVYYYEMLVLPDESAAQTLANNLVTLEKTFHSTAVTFVRARVWKHGGSAATNEMITQFNLSGTGARSATPNPDKERAWLFRIRAGVDSRGKPVYLRKWYHACGEFVASQGIPANVLTQTAGWSSTERAQQVTAMQNIGDANGSSNAPKLCAKSGRLPTAGEAFQAHQYLEHHQLGDQWRAQ